jgi:hypothetical protein
MTEPAHPRDAFVVYWRSREGGVRPVPRACVLMPEVDDAALVAMKAFLEHPDVRGSRMGHDLHGWIEQIESGATLATVPSGNDGAKKPK